MARNRRFVSDYEPYETGHRKELWFRKVTVGSDDLVEFNNYVEMFCRANGVTMEGSVEVISDFDMLSDYGYTYRDQKAVMWNPEECQLKQAHTAPLLHEAGLRLADADDAAFDELLMFVRAEAVRRGIDLTKENPGQAED